MIVVADSSPLIVLIAIQQIDILPKLFGRVIIPPEVSAELIQAKRPQAVQDFGVSPPPWLIVQSLSRFERIPKLHAGEAAAIGLAIELEADLLLIDERDGRKAAVARNVRVTGTIGVLEQAAERGLVELKDAFDGIKKTDFWISPKLLDARLQLYQKRRKK